MKHRATLGGVLVLLLALAGGVHVAVPNSTFQVERWIPGLYWRHVMFDVMPTDVEVLAWRRRSSGAFEPAATLLGQYSLGYSHARASQIIGLPHGLQRLCATSHWLQGLDLRVTGYRLLPQRRVTATTHLHCDGRRLVPNRHEAEDVP